MYNQCIMPKNIFQQADSACQLKSMEDLMRPDGPYNITVARRKSNPRFVFARVLPSICGPVFDGGVPDGKHV
jgi:hypothetical protein